MAHVLGLRPASKIDLFLETRAAAAARGDSGVYRAMCIELERVGYVEPAALETTAVQAPERAVPPPKRTRRTS